MDHYFLYICDEFSALEEEFLRHYIKSLAPSHSEINYGLFLSSLLQNSVYFNCINVSLKTEENIEWKKINSALEVSQLIPDKISEENQGNTKSVVDSCCAADNINNLADQLLPCGAFKLDVIISEQIVKNFNIDANIELVAALHRLSKWHAAHSVVLSHAELNPAECEEWFALTNAEVLKCESRVNKGHLLWRGSIELKHSNTAKQTLDGFELRIDTENSSAVSGTTASWELKHKGLVLHPVLHAVDLCSYSSIPQHLLIPVVFNVYNSCTASDDAVQLLDHICKNNEAALIVRLGYSILNERPSSNKTLCTSKWKKMVASGNVKYPESLLPYVDNYQTMVITKSPNSKNLIAYFFKELSCLNSQFYFNAVNSWNVHSQHITKKNLGKENLEFDLSLPFVSDEELSLQLLKIQTMDGNLSCKNESTANHSNDFMTAFIESVLSSETSVHFRGNPKVIYDEIDPTDWPERVYLLHKQMQAEEEKKNMRSVFLNLSPQRSQYNVSLSGEDIKKYFLPNGEAKETRKTEPVQLISNQLICNHEHLQEIIKKEWPDVLNCVYGDIYYNVNQQSEEKENVGNEMVRCFVQHETASTCNKQQIVPDAPISVLAKYLTPRKRPRSSKPETSLRQDMMKPNAKVKENILKTADVHKNPVISTIMRTLGVKKSPQAEQNSAHKRIPRKNSAPVRCSPRKRTSVNYYPSTSRQSSTQQNKVSPKDMPELIKKKLRVAVASALESHKIGMQDALFRPCFKKLFSICQTFVQDIPRKGSTSQHMQKIADAHVKQVIKFEKQKEVER